MWSRKLKCANRSTKRCSVAGSTRSAPLMMPSTPPRSSPARSLSVVLRAAKSKAKLGADDHACGFSARDRTHLAGLSKNATGLVSSRAIAAQDWCADSQHQTHVVVEGQPRHNRGIWWDFGVREKAAHQLLEIHREVAVRDHDPGRQSGRTRAVLQIRDARQIGCRKACSALGIQIQRIDLDDLWSGVHRRLIDIIADIFRDRGRRENNCGRRIGKDRTDPLITRAAVRQRERNRDEPGLHGSQERQDVIKALRGQDHCPVSDRPMKADLACHIHCSAG